ncbi:hypothetical protein EsCd1HHP024_00022 [Escherichia sp. HH091_1A]|nr:hypothetical protein EsCd1HHP024_00022 [Escherichia sp. HH091_1A]
MVFKLKLKRTLLQLVLLPMHELTLISNNKGKGAPGKTSEMLELSGNEVIEYGIVKFIADKISSKL